LINHQATTTGTRPTGLATSTDYYIIKVDAFRVKLATSLENANAGTVINLTALGSGVHTLTWTNTFTAAASDICTANDHGLLTCDGPFQATNSGGALPAGLAGSTDYWIVKLSANTFSLAASYADATAATPVVVDISGAGTGTHTLARSTASGTVSQSANHVCCFDHRLQTGDGPFRLSTSGGLPTGLNTGTDYWAIRVSDSAVSFAESYDEALSGDEVDLSGAGTGTFVVTATSTAVEAWLKRGRSLRELKALDA
jgi:hypothetical protein